MFWQNYTRIEDFGNEDWDYQVVSENLDVILKTALSSKFTKIKAVVT